MRFYLQLNTKNIFNLNNMAPKKEDPFKEKKRKYLMIDINI